MSNLLDAAKKQQEQGATGGEEARLAKLKEIREACSKEIGLVLQRFNCTLTASILIDMSGNYPNIQIVNKELLNVNTQDTE
jgi:hypothetical protein